MFGKLFGAATPDMEQMLDGNPADNSFQG